MVNVTASRALSAQRLQEPFIREFATYQDVIIIMCRVSFAKSFVRGLFIVLCICVCSVVASCCRGFSTA